MILHRTWTASLRKTSAGCASGAGSRPSRCRARPPAASSCCSGPRSRSPHTHTHTPHTAHPRAPGLAPLSAVGLLSSSREGLAWPLPHHLECVEETHLTSPYLHAVARGSGCVALLGTRPRHVHDTWPQVAGKEVVVLGRSNIVGERAHTAASRRRAQRDLCPRPALGMPVAHLLQSVSGTRP